MSSAPDPPDPYAVSAAQTQSNKETASYNAALNRVSTYTPYGDLVYSQTGTDSTGAPTYRSDVSLTPATQHQLDTQQQQNSAIADLGLGLTNKVGNSINQPLSDQAQSNTAARDAYYAKQTAYLDPQYKNMQSDLDSSLANKGVIQNSDAYNRAQEELGRQRTQAYSDASNTAIGQGQTAQQQALANEITLQNQPMNQLSALRSGTQIQNPTFPTTPGATANGTDVSGNVYNSYNAQLAAFNANNPLGGLMGLGAAAIMA